MKIICKVKEHDRLAELDKMLDDINVVAKERAMFLSKQAETARDNYEKDHGLVWDKITGYLVSMDLITTEQAENENIGFEDNHKVTKGQIDIFASSAKALKGTLIKDIKEALNL